jgi:hypothetical protein
MVGAPIVGSFVNRTGLRQESDEEGCDGQGHG